MPVLAPPHSERYREASPEAGSPPPLEAGDHLSVEEFRRRYTAMPHTKKAELLHGVVYMPSPVSLRRHSLPHADLIIWLGVYRIATPGLESGDNATTRLGPESEPQPDALLFIPGALGGRSREAPDDYLEGGPELVAEVASSSVSYDLHVKKAVYAEAGIPEYLVWRVGDQAVDWFVLQDGRYAPLAPGEDGVLRSTVFPGLWLDPAALTARDMARVLAVLHHGLATPEHTRFQEHLTAATGASDPP